MKKFKAFVELKSGEKVWYDYTTKTGKILSDGYVSEKIRKIIAEDLQFTNLVDKNGHEFIEDDVFILKFKLKKIIRFIPEKFGFCIANVSDLKYEKDWEIWSNIRKDWIDERKSDIEYIGNSIENTELLSE